MKETYKSAVAARKAGIKVLSVAVGNNIDKHELQVMTSDPDDRNLFFLPDFSKLDTAVKWLADAICNSKLNLPLPLVSVSILSNSFPQALYFHTPLYMICEIMYVM